MRISFFQAQERLLRGEIVALPTDTVYGLGALARSQTAISELRRLKRRPQDKAFPLHIPHERSVLEYCDSFPPGFFSLTKRHWPGALSIVLDLDLALQKKLLARALFAKDASLALRQPNHKLLQEMLTLVGPLAMPSANLPSFPPACNAETIEASFGKDFPILDDGPSPIGEASTLIAWSQQSCTWESLRQGSIVI